MKAPNIIEEKALKGAKRNAAMLAVSNFASLGIPLIELPILAHALGVETYGVLLFLHGIALTAAIFVEYGFHYNGARAIAQAARNDQTEARIVTNILTAKSMLYMAALVAALSVYAIAFDEKLPHGQIALCMLLAAYGFSPAWYFLGRNNLKIPMVADITFRLIGLLLIVFFVHAPEDVDVVLLIQCSVGLLNSAIPCLVMIRATGLARPDFKLALREVCMGWKFFIYKGATGVASSIATTVLGMTSTATQVGLFAPSEKLIRAGSTFVTTVLSAFFPISVQHVMAQGDAFRQRLLKPLVILFCLLLLVASVIAVLSNTLIRLIFGSSFSDATPLLQLMAFLIPFRTISALLSILWLIPANREDVTSRLALGNIVFVSCLGFVIAPIAGATGMAAVLALGEIGLFIATLYYTCTISASKNKKHYP